MAGSTGTGGPSTGREVIGMLSQNQKPPLFLKHIVHEYRSWHRAIGKYPEGTSLRCAKYAWESVMHQRLVYESWKR